MSRIPEETDANANLSLIKSRSKLMKQKASSNKSENGIAFKAGNIAITAKKSKRKKTSAEELSDQEKETVIQEVLGYMLGHRPSQVLLSESKEKLATVVSDHQHLPIDASFQVCQQPSPKPFVSAKLATTHIHQDGTELKSAPTTTSFSNRRSQCWERKRSTQQLQNDKVDHFIEYPHHNIIPQSAKARARTSLTSGAHYWPRVLVSSDLNNLLSRLHADNATIRRRMVKMFTKSKGRQRRTRITAIWNESSTCPISILLRYLQLADELVAEIAQNFRANPDQQ